MSSLSFPWDYRKVSPRLLWVKWCNTLGNFPDEKDRLWQACQSPPLTEGVRSSPGDGKTPNPHSCPFSLGRCIQCFCYFIHSGKYLSSTTTVQPGQKHSCDRHVNFYPGMPDSLLTGNVTGQIAPLRLHFLIWLFGWQQVSFIKFDNAWKGLCTLPDNKCWLLSLL